jgi:hypothetical protein
MGESPYVGFIYAIYDKVLNRAYIGKKSYRSSGPVNRGKESNWRKYTSSSKLINDLLKVRPKSEFDFICIEQYKTKSGLNYSETWTLCFVEAPTTVNFYNTLIEKVSWNIKEPITERHKKTVIELLERIKAANG